MLQHAFLCFHQSLNDFLRKRRKAQWNSHAFQTPSSVKDVVEAMGVPHVEVSKILVNEKEKAFNYLVQPKDKIDVFPFEHHFPASAPTSFILDVHLGKLARLLRMLGIDVAYQNNWHDREIVSIAVAENRAVLTRDVGLLKHKVLTWGYWLRSQNPEVQLIEVIRQFSLCAKRKPFTRCMACNGLLYPVPKDEIISLLPEETQKNFEEFYWCRHCGKIYWKGSHYENMQRLIEWVASFAC